MTTSAARYLIIPEEYAVPLGGLRWSPSREAIETGDGQTFAFAAQVWHYLEGFMSIRPPLHFAHVLHLMHLLGIGPITRVPEHGEELRRAFLLAGRPLRNAGVFCAAVCHDFPGTALRLELAALRLEIIHQPASVASGEAPPLPFVIFQQRFLRALEQFTAGEIVHWLKFGQAPQKRAGERLAEEIDRRPPNVVEALCRAARDRERLAGALALVPSLNGALTIPPRRLDSQDLPLGGYADVTTRGEPERLLPSQYALESEEFVRRFAEHELLFFRREEPSRPAREELLVLLDQGVRTWGGVRLALAGAAFALARVAQRRGIPFRLAATSNKGETVDPLALESPALGQLLEASDLSAGPAALLRALLEGPAERPRDVVVLTHPRSLLGDEFAAAAAAQRPEDRLFAVSVDSEGRGRMDHLREGHPLPVSRFRVDLAAALNPPALRRHDASTDPAAWSGDVEPVPFPFWFGPVKPVRHVGFDAAGEWLLVATAHGLLHAQTVDGKRREVLPRGVSPDGRVLRTVDSVLGTHGGFAICGRIEAPAGSERRTQLVAVHYDFGRRRACCYALPERPNEEAVWFSFPELHSVACRQGNEIWGVDLATGARYPELMPPSDATRAKAAAVRATQRSAAPPRVADEDEALDDEEWYRFESGPGWIELGGLLAVNPSRRSAAPLVDGEPILRNARIVEVQHAGNVMALNVELSGSVGRRLFLLRSPDMALLRELALPREPAAFRLSTSGRLVARQLGPQEVSVFETDSGGPAVAVMPIGRCHTNVETNLGRDWLIVTIGRYRHLFRWAAEELRYSRGDAFPADWPRDLGASAGELGPLTRHDPDRFHPRLKHRLRVEVDRFGHVLVLDAAGERLVAMFWFQRDKAAAWLPDGTRWGASELGGPPTPDAPARFARALRAACGSAR